MKISEKVIHNTLFSSFGYAWWVLVSLFLTPYIIAKVGLEGYGLFVVLEAALGYVTVLDITGINISLVKFVSEHHARKDFDALGRLVRMAFVYYLFFFGAVTLCVWFLRRPLLGLFRIDAAWLSVAATILAGLLAVMFLRGVFGILKTVLFGLQRMDIENGILIAAVTANIGFTVYFLEAGYGVAGVVLASFLMVAFAACLRIVFVARLLPRAVPKGPFFDARLFGSALLYGIKMQVIAFAELINKGVDKVLLGALAGVTLGGLYEIGAKVANITNLLPALFLPSVLPAASELHVMRDERRLEDLYVRGTKYMMMLLAPLCCFAVLHAGLIIRAWMGIMARPESVLAVQFLTLAYGVYLVTSVGRYMARGIGVLGFELGGSILLAALNILLSFALIRRIGFVGALWGTAAAALTGSLWFMARFHRYLKFSVARFLGRSVLGPLAASLLAAAVTFFMPARLAGQGGRLVLFGRLFFDGAVFTVLYVALVRGFRLVDAYEREVFVHALRKFVKR
ncbi:MAG: polysaccharide biosynthesis C-terminal domain-containing protein [Deltaproteobacteria bacterium]